MPGLEKEGQVLDSYKDGFLFFVLLLVFLVLLHRILQVPFDRLEVPHEQLVAT